MQTKASSLLNLLTAALLAATGPTAAAAVFVFAQPQTPLNPFPPPTSPVIAMAPSPSPSATFVSLFPTFPPTWTPTFTPLPTATRTPHPTVTPTPTHTPLPPPPPSALIENIVGHAQALPLSCESRSAADWAAYFGVAVDEVEFLLSLPISEDPNVGFVGDVLGQWGQLPPDAYGVHAEPVAAQLRQHGLWARAVTDLSWEALQNEVAAGRPVIAWVAGHVERGTPIQYTPADTGRTTVVARYEHTVIVVGYSPERVIVLDGQHVTSHPVDVFLQSWAVLGNMAVIYQPAGRRK